MRISSDDFYRYVTGIFLTALLSRLMFFFAFSSRIFYGYNLDSQFYISYARDLLAHHSIASYSQGPLYPFFLALSFLVFGDSLSVFIFIQIVLMAAAAALFFALARRYFDDTRCALFAGLLFALDPMLIYFSSFIMTENMFIFLLIGFLLLLLISWEKDTIAWLAAAGAVLGLSLLCRSVCALFMPALFIVGFIRNGFSGIRKAALITLFALLTILPWQIQLYRHFKSFIFIQVKSGVQLYQSLAPYGLGPRQMTQWHSEFGLSPEEAGVNATQNELLIDTYYKQRSMDWIRSNPRLFLVRSIQKVIDFWRPYLNYPYPLMVSIFTGIYISAIYILSSMSLVRMKRPYAMFIGAFIIAAFLPFCVFFPQIRYRLPVHVMLLLLSAGGLASLLYEHKNTTEN